MKILICLVIITFTVNSAQASIGVGAINAFAQVASAMMGSTRHSDPIRPDSSYNQPDFSNSINQRYTDVPTELSENYTDWDRYYQNQSDFFSTYLTHKKELDRLEDKRFRLNFWVPLISGGLLLGAKFCEIYGENKRREEFVLSEIDRLNWEIENSSL